MSSMKRPRPVNSDESSTRGIDCPTHGELESLLANASLLARAWLAASAIPKNPPAHVGCVRRNYLEGSPMAAISTNLKTYHPVSFSRCAVQHQLARREIFRNSRGLTPACLLN